LKNVYRSFKALIGLQKFLPDVIALAKMKNYFFEKIINRVKDGLNQKNSACLEHVISVLRMVLNYKDPVTMRYFYFETKIIFILPLLI